MEVSVSQIIPEIVLLVAAAVALLVGLSKADAVRKLAQWVAAAGLAAAFLLGIPNGPGLPEGTLSAVQQHAPWVPYVTLLTCAIGFLTVLASWNMPAKFDPGVSDTHYRGEFFAMMLFSLAGVSMVAKVNDLVWLFIVLELVSIPTYILVATGRSQSNAQEAGVKYFFLGALSAAIYLFGFSYLYGYAGSTRFEDIATLLSSDLSRGQVPYLAVIGMIVVIIGVAYKIAAVPLHFYTPDVYQGAATPVTAFLAYAPKAAGMVAIIGLLTMHNARGLPDASAMWWNRPLVTAGANTPQDHASVIIPALLAVMCTLTMTVGNVLALLQRNLKRIFAYSSIAHSGYMLVGLVAGPGNGGTSFSTNGIMATLFYLAGYAFMNLGALAAIIYLQGKTDAAEDIDDLAGVSREHPLAAIGLMICLFSLIGMPFTVGFYGKFFLIQSAFSTGHWAIAIITVLNAAIAAAYYLRIIGAMFLREAWSPFSVRETFAPPLSAALCTLAVLVFGVAPSLLLNQATTNYPAPSHPAPVALTSAR